MGTGSILLVQGHQNADLDCTFSYKLSSPSDFQDHPWGLGDVGAERTSSSSSPSWTSLVLASADTPTSLHERACEQTRFVICLWATSPRLGLP